jgi:hypothetical protein
MMVVRLLGVATNAEGPKSRSLPVNIVDVEILLRVPVEDRGIAYDPS